MVKKNKTGLPEEQSLIVEASYRDEIDDSCQDEMIDGIMIRPLTSQQGFTIVELLIVIIIVGILAVIAIPNFLAFRMKAKTSEAKTNLGAIRVALEAYKAEENSYGSRIRLYPRRTSLLSGTKATWINTLTGFSTIGFEPAGDVYYSYRVNYNAILNISHFDAYAFGDLDDDNQIARFSVDETGKIMQLTDKNIF